MLVLQYTTKEKNNTNFMIYFEFITDSIYKIYSKNIKNKLIY
jgi:hypothetical protein